MGKRGPTPQGELTVVKFTSNDRPNPPAGMTARARNLFRKIVSENPSGTFFDGDAVMLLKAFCEAETNHYEATKAIQKEGSVIESMIGWDRRNDCPMTKKVLNPWFHAQKESSAIMASMSAKLRAKRVEVGVAKKDRKTVPGRVMFGE